MNAMLPALTVIGVVESVIRATERIVAAAATAAVANTRIELIVWALPIWIANKIIVWIAKILSLIVISIATKIVSIVSRPIKVVNILRKLIQVKIIEEIVICVLIVLLMAEPIVRIRMAKIVLIAVFVRVERSIAKVSIIRWAWFLYEHISFARAIWNCFFLQIDISLNIVRKKKTLQKIPLRNSFRIFWFLPNILLLTRPKLLLPLFRSYGCIRLLPFDWKLPLFELRPPKLLRTGFVCMILLINCCSVLRNISIYLRMFMNEIK